jgi:hypothetical protein
MVYYSEETGYMKVIQIGYFGDGWVICLDSAMNLLFVDKFGNLIASPTFEEFNEIVKSEEDLELIFFNLICQVPFDYGEFQVERTKIKVLCDNKSDGITVRKATNLLYSDFKAKHKDYKLKLYDILNIIASALPDDLDYLATERS